MKPDYKPINIYSDSNLAISARNRILLTRIMKLQLTGEIQLPYRIGLSEFEYTALLRLLNHRGIRELDLLWQSDKTDQKQSLSPQISKAKLSSDILETLRAARLQEWDELVQLMVSKTSPAQVEDNRLVISIVARIMATACLQPAHLWQNLGFGSREELSRMLHDNFLSLAVGNNKSMRWKRYFYLQLCESGGDYVCRAPSCDQCSSHSECFGAEI